MERPMDRPAITYLLAAAAVGCGSPATRQPVIASPMPTDAAAAPSLTVAGAPSHCLVQAILPAGPSACGVGGEGELLLDGATAPDGWCRLECGAEDPLWIVQIERKGFRGTARCSVGQTVLKLAFQEPPVESNPDVLLIMTDEFEPLKSLKVKIDLQTGRLLEKRRASSPSCGGEP